MRTALYRRARNLWGTDAQLRVLQEEAAEVIVAISHALRHGSDGRYMPEDILAMSEEMADLEIMLEQARTMGFAKHIHHFKLNKLSRLEKLVEKEEELVRKREQERQRLVNLTQKQMFRDFHDRNLRST